MRDLHVVAVSEDGRHVLLASRRGTTKVTYRVALDERLLAAVRGDLPQPGAEAAAASELTPKEIQARLRAGESAASIAAVAGVPITRVERFGGPVQGEMARVIDAARASYVVRGRLGRSVLALGDAVDLALATQPGLRPDSTEWSTYRQEDGTWKVTVQWFARARLRDASWVYDSTAKGLVVASDAASAALGHATQDGLDAPKPVPKAAKPAKKAPAKKAPAKKAVPAKKAAPAKKAVPAKKAPAKKAAPATVAPVKKPVRARVLQVVPDPVPTRRTPATKRTAAERDGVTTRASVPGWADVLLGTTPGSKL